MLKIQLNVSVSQIFGKTGNQWLPEALAPPMAQGDDLPLTTEP